MGYANRPGSSGRGRAAEPLLNGADERGRTSYEAEGGSRSRSREGRYRLRSVSPVGVDAAKIAGRRKYALAAVFLVLSLVSFVVSSTNPGELMGGTAEDEDRR